MEYRTFGRTGWNVSAIGFGAWGIGGDAWGPTDDKTSLATLNQAIDLGVNFFDTADVYGDGHSEQLIAHLVLLLFSSASCYSSSSSSSYLLVLRLQLLLICSSSSSTRVPLASGMLTGKFTRNTQFDPNDHRNFNRHGEAFDQGETFSGVDYEVGLQAVEELRSLRLWWSHNGTIRFALDFDVSRGIERHCGS